MKQGKGFPALSAGGLSQGRTEAQGGGGQMPRQPLLAADLRRSGGVDLREPVAAVASWTRLRSRQEPRTVRRVFAKVHIYGRPKYGAQGVRICYKKYLRMFANYS